MMSQVSQLNAAGPAAPCHRHAQRRVSRWFVVSWLAAAALAVVGCQKPQARTNVQLDTVALVEAGQALQVARMTTQMPMRMQEYGREVNFADWEGITAEGVALTKAASSLTADRARAVTGSPNDAQAFYEELSQSIEVIRFERERLERKIVQIVAESTENAN